jgi:hypothetical protein
MLRFLIGTGGIDFERQSELEETLRRMQTGGVALREKAPSATWKMELKDLMKRCMALRYRAIPTFLSMAEQGLSVSLAKPKAQSPAA